MSEDSNESGSVVSFPNASGDAVSQPSQEVTRRSWSFDPVGQMAQCKEGGITVPFSIAAMPENVATWLQYMGMTVVLGRADDMKATFESLKAGNVPTRGKGGGAPSLWRKAVALALVEATKKTENPLTIDDATAKALALPKDRLAALQKDPVVVKHFSKLSGGSSALAEVAAA